MVGGIVMAAKLNKKLRQEIYNKYDGHCAYCGCDMIDESYHPFLINNQIVNTLKNRG